MSWTRGVSHTRNSDMRSGGQRRRAELSTVPCATQPRVAPRDARPASRAWSHLSKDEGRTKAGPSSTNHSSQTPVASREQERNSRRWASLASPRSSALWMVPNTSACTAPRLVANVTPVGREVTESGWCCHSVQAAASEKCVRRAWRTRGHPQNFTTVTDLHFFLFSFLFFFFFLIRNDAYRIQVGSPSCT